MRPPSVRQHAMPYMLANAASDSRVNFHIELPDVESRYLSLVSRRSASYASYVGCRATLRS